MRATLLVHAFLTLALLAGCSDSDANTNEGASGTAGSASGGAAGGGADTGGAGNGGASGGASDSFSIRSPETHALVCTDSGGSGIDPNQEFADADTVCTFVDGDVTGLVYVQATPTSCAIIMSAQATYEVVAKIIVDGAAKPLPDAIYEGGGNHGNDSLEFSYNGKTYRYYHSSFGWGWHACSPMDCVQITVDGTTDDGCTCDRTHPIVCSPIKEDGTYDPLDVDNFALCPGDETCGS
jgi:hypothetical protein